MSRRRGDFDDVATHDIVKALVRERSTKTDSGEAGSQVHPLTCGHPIYVLRHGDDHRGGTFYDGPERVVWLVAYRRHRSGEPGDFFPYCKGLDSKGRLLPTRYDYRLLFEERALRFVYAVRIEAPLVLRKAREDGAEQRVMLGGNYGACVSVEVADDIEETTVALDAESVPQDYLEIILNAFHATPTWHLADRMPSRPLDAREIAFSHVHNG